jgi:phosphoribosylanthranilate isomerase
MSRTRIKICGLTRVSDVQMCTDAGVDLIGIVLVPGSKRCVSMAQAHQLITAARPFTRTVLLFMDHPAAEVQIALRDLQPDFVQFRSIVMRTPRRI